MPNPGLRLEVWLQTREAIHECLKKGYRAEGVMGEGVGAVSKAAEVLGIDSPSTVRNRITTAKRRFPDHPVDWTLWVDPNYIEYSKLHAAPAPRRKVLVHQTDVPDGPSIDVVGIGDLHDSPHLEDKSRFKWIGRYINECKPDHIIQIGDWGTFDSCSQFENYGSISGRLKPSYEADLQSLAESTAVLNGELDKKYKPKKRITKGNHETRVHQYEDSNPETEGMWALRMDQVYGQAGFEITEYKDWFFIDGVGFTHFPMTIMGKPYGGKHPENQIANDSTFSMVVGHTHKGGMKTAPKIGHNNRVNILNLGCALPHGHIEPYALGSTSGWTYGINRITIQGGDIQSHRFISMLELEEKYG